MHTVPNCPSTYRYYKNVFSTYSGQVYTHRCHQRTWSLKHHLNTRLVFAEASTPVQTRFTECRTVNNCTTDKLWVCRLINFSRGPRPPSHRFAYSSKQVGNAYLYLFHRYTVISFSLNTVYTVRPNRVGSTFVGSQTKPPSDEPWNYWTADHMTCLCQFNNRALDH